MARLSLLLCFSILVASGTLHGVVSPTLLPAIKEPETVKDVEPYAVKVVMTFVVDLEKECPKTQEFKVFFERLKAYAKYVCPNANATGAKDVKAYESDMKAKASGLFQATSAFAAGQSESGGLLKMTLKRDELESMEIVNSLQSMFGKIMMGRNGGESDGSTKLTMEQQKAIKDTILRWEQVITRVVKTMVRSSDSPPPPPRMDNSGGKAGSAKAQTQVLPRGSGDITRGNSEEALRSSPVEIKGGVGVSANGNTVDNKASDANSTNDKATDNQGGSTNGTTVENKGSDANSRSLAEAYGSNTIDAKGGGENVTNSGAMESNGNATASETIVADTSNEVMGFIMNLEKKCPETEEFKAFFEKLKAYMKYACPVSSMVGNKNPRAYMSEMISTATKLSDAMSLVQARMSKSGQTKNEMQSYQQGMMNTLNVLQGVVSKVVNENQSKKDGSVTVTQTQQKVIKETITKWEQVTTQFVKTAVESETRFSTETKSSSQRSKAENRKTKSLK